MSGSPSLHRIFGSAAAGLALVVLTAIGPTDVAAQTNSPDNRQAASQTAGTHSVSEVQDSAYWWFYLSALGFVAMVPLGLFLYRRFGSEESYDIDPRELPFEPGPSGESALADGATGEGGLSRPEKAIFSIEETNLEESSAQMALGQTGGTQRICPDCGERFPQSVVLCPYDSTPLSKIEEGTPQASPSDETVLERQRCPGCGRRFEAGPDYCYHDGMRLRQDTVEDAEDAPVFKVCETCGWEGQAEDRLCPRDGRELTVVDPSEESRISPPIPVLVCPECGEYAAPGSGRCPEDGAALTPLENAHQTELPGYGFGPRRKICQECGGKFNSSARYCTKDGSELVPMN